MPHSLQAEQCVLACLMLDYVGCGDGLVDKLQKDDFYSPVHQTIFEAMLGVIENKKNVDFVTVVESLTVAKKLDVVGGVAYINIITDTVPSVANFRNYFDIVKKNSVLRKLNSAAKQILESSYASDDEQLTLQEAEQVIFDIAKQDEHKELTALSHELPLVMQRIDNIRKNPATIYGISTGFYGIDSVTNGLHGGELIILAARTGVGKTSLGLNMVLNAAIESGKKCAIFSLEMDKESLVRRAVCSRAMVSSTDVARGELDDARWQRLVQATDVLDSVNIYIDDSSDITPTEIRRKCIRLKREHGLDFVMVDYLGLLNPGQVRRENRQAEVAANSRAMKILAKELNVPVLLLAQLNREVVTQSGKTVDKRPQLHHLRESGAIEQDADIVMFIHTDRPTENNSDEEDDQPEQPEATEAEVIIAKHRKGATGVVKLAWRKEYTTFENLSQAQAAKDARKRAAQSKKPAPTPVQQQVDLQEKSEKPEKKKK